MTQTAEQTPTERLLNVEQLASLLGISARSIYRLVEDGMPHLRVRGQLRFDSREVLDALRRRGPR